MKRAILIGFTLVVGVLLVWLIPHLSQPVIGQAASLEAPHVGQGGLPQFQLDPNFPNVPTKWRMGMASAVSIDADNNVWILSRPRTLAHPAGRHVPPDLTSTPAPPVTEFDNNGNFIQGWGGQSGPGYQWPSNEHGMTVDYKGYVWIVGNTFGNQGKPGADPNDNQILKFTKDGKFVMAIGQNGQVGSNATEVLGGATEMAVYPKTNEVFVSDGYQNSRVIVFDADTGKFKRMWGAYGRKPLDVAARPAITPVTPNMFCPVLCGVYTSLQQFQVPHSISISSDGLVYVVDRGNRRVQMFTIDGKFITEQFLGLDSKWPLQAMSAALSPDDQFLYVAATPVVRILNAKTLEVLGSFLSANAQEHPLGHGMIVDHKGNIFIVQADLIGPDDKQLLGTVVHKFVFKGYSPRTTCPPCESTRGPDEKSAYE